MSRRRKELRGALGHGLFGLCVNPSLTVSKPEQCDQIVNGVFCQTFTKSCQIHCQITKITLPKYLQNSVKFFSLNDLL